MTVAFKLIAASLERGDYSVLLKAKGDWFDVKERLAYEFVKDYYRENSELPSSEIFYSKFSLKDKVSGRPGYFLRELKNRYISGTLVDTVPGIMRNLAKDPEKGLEQFRKVLFKLNTDTYTSKDVDYAFGARDRFKAYADRIATKGVTHLSTGIEIFDETFYGYRPADLITIGGRAGMGKSWFILFLALCLESVLKKKGSKQLVLIVSNEMPEDEIIERMDCLQAKLPYEEFMNGGLSRKQRRLYKAFLEKLESEGSLIKVVYNVGTIDELNALIELYGPAAVYLDGSYLMEQDQGEGWEKITYVTRNLKQTAKAKSTPIINTTQLKRAAGKGSSKLSIDGQDDFAYSSSYAMDSDIAVRMFQTSDMVFNAEVGLEVVKGRRVKPNTRYTFKNDLAIMLQQVYSATEESLEPAKVEW